MRIKNRAILVTANGSDTRELIGLGAVIGNNMGRVYLVSEVLGAASFSVRSERCRGEWFRNLRWMIEQVFTKDFILDIGPIPGQPAYGTLYPMERFVTRLLCNKRKVFERT